MNKCPAPAALEEFHALFSNARGGRFMGRRPFRIPVNVILANAGSGTQLVRTDSEPVCGLQVEAPNRRPPFASRIGRICDVSRRQSAAATEGGVWCNTCV